MVSTLTLSIGIGLFVGLLFIELFSLFCGGVIVPGYIAIHLNNPYSVIATLFISLLAFIVVKGLSQFTLLYGRRQYVALMITAFIFGALLNSAIPTLLPNTALTVPGAPSDAFGVIGFVIPGLIANWYERQGILVTTCTVLSGAALVRLILISLGYASGEII
ncbi:poly-gamma-glutamate biosynthesis protein PgsC [Algicola sagamiensis]|uniref:poly-gamma-glutamate biosynthesis protein PgsC n=1 Tax=Algicola sagamiensis TaxID=163869 RepID=UPI00037D9463|nr:poly-gamma-glutamate biosynthesis protein PgsC [Algicola sagamiensis]